MCMDLGQQAQGFGNTKGTEAVFFMTKDEIKRIPKDCTVTYAHIIVHYCPKKGPELSTNYNQGQSH